MFQNHVPRVIHFHWKQTCHLCSCIFISLSYSYANFMYVIAKINTHLHKIWFDSFLSEWKEKVFYLSFEASLVMDISREGQRKAIDHLWILKCNKIFFISDLRKKNITFILPKWQNNYTLREKGTKNILSGRICYIKFPM